MDCALTWSIGDRFDVCIEGAEHLVRPLFNEAGGHRWQRVPPTERRGRVHTSTVTVAVFEIAPRSQWRLRDADIEVFTTKGSGPGGQHRNKTESCVVMRHIPTSIEARADSRSQAQNKVAAREVLEARVAECLSSKAKVEHDARRKGMVGSGQRADKIRTYRMQDDQVSDHRTGRKVRLREVVGGDLAVLFEM
jgi:peptide chain release factor 1